MIEQGENVMAMMTARRNPARDKNPMEGYNTGGRWGQEFQADERCDMRRITALRSLSDALRGVWW
jgi:hypothetical protein